MASVLEQHKEMSVRRGHTGGNVQEINGSRKGQSREAPNLEARDTQQQSRGDSGVEKFKSNGLAIFATGKDEKQICLPRRILANQPPIQTIRKIARRIDRHREIKRPAETRASAHVNARRHIGDIIVYKIFRC
jgi:hypothetical protein